MARSNTPDCSSSIRLVENLLTNSIFRRGKRGSWIERSVEAQKRVCVRSTSHMESLIHTLHYRSRRLGSSFAIEKRKPRLLHIGAARLAQDNVLAVTEKQRTANQGFYILGVFRQHGLTNAQSAGRTPKVQESLKKRGGAGNRP